MTLKEAREAVGLSQRKLDRLAGCSANTTHNIESGKVANPRWSDAHRLTEALRRQGLVGITPEQIFSATEPATQKASA